MEFLKINFEIYILVSFLLTTSVIVDTKNVEDETHLGEERVGTADNDSETGPSSVTSVSKFITEFHKQIDGQLYWVPKRAEPVSETGYPDKPEATPPATVSDTDDELNSTSLVNCKMERQAGSLTVEVVNSTRLISLLITDPNITSRSQKADCVVLLFYARTCPFSCMAAPHFNALPRAFPAIKMAAVNAVQYPGFNTQYGIVGMPTVMLFHNGRPASKFNDSEYTLDMFSRFITRHSGILPEEKMFVTSTDFGGPVGSVVARETDYYLGLSWLVIAVVGVMGVTKSRMWHNLVEAVQNSWREAEAQHFHTD